MILKRWFDGSSFRAAALLLVIIPQARAAEASSYHINPAKVVGPENCAECHAPIVEAWKVTHHFDTFNSMHRRPEAQQIQSKLGLKRIKVESLCLKCHYTSQESEGQMKVIAGISCESCHGAAADWNLAHSNKDDLQRLVKAEKLGMIRPSAFARVAANCFQCHTVPEERLVNEGGHKPGSDFELVSWSQGEVRHNLQQSNGKKNEEAPPAQKRMLYIVGQALDLEYGLRGLARATQEGKFAASMVQRIRAGKGRLKEIHEATKLEPIQAMLAAADERSLQINREADLLKAAGKVAELTVQLLATQDGTKLAPVDALIPGPARYKGKVYQPQL